MEVKTVALPDQGVVVVTISGCEYDALDEIDKHLHTNSPIDVRWHDKSYHMNKYYRGVARCHPSDTWDDHIGEDLAFERAYAKYIKAKKRIINKFCNKAFGNLSDIMLYVRSNKKYLR